MGSREAAGKMQDTIFTQLAASLEVISKKLTKDMNALSIRLDDRITRSRENQDALVERVANVVS